MLSRYPTNGNFYLPGSLLGIMFSLYVIPNLGSSRPTVFIQFGSSPGLGTVDQYNGVTERESNVNTRIGPEGCLLIPLFLSSE